MLRGYDREIVDAINSCVEVSTFVPALGYTFARNPIEIEVAHADRSVRPVQILPLQPDPAQLRPDDGILRHAAAFFLDGGHGHLR